MSDLVADVCVQRWEDSPGMGTQALEERLAKSGQRAVGRGSRGGREPRGQRFVDEVLWVRGRRSRTRWQRVRAPPRRDGA